MIVSRLAIGIVAGCALSLTSIAATAQTITWANHKQNPAGFPLVANEIAWAAKVEKATGGRLKINVLPLGASGFKGTEILDAIDDNLLQMAEIYGSLVAGQDLILEMLDLPNFVPGDLEFRKKFWDELKPLYADFLEKKYNLKLLDVMQNPPRRLFTKAPVKTLSDLQGLKIRAIGPADGAFVRGLGAQPTTTEWSELYPALQQGLVDGHMAVYAAQFANKFHEVTSHIFETENAGPTFFLVVNRDAFSKLPADLQDTLLKMHAELREANRASLVPMEERARKALIDGGMTLNPVNEADQKRIREVSKPIIDSWAARLDKDSLPIFQRARTLIDGYYASK